MGLLANLFSKHKPESFSFVESTIVHNDNLNKVEPKPVDTREAISVKARTLVDMVHDGIGNQEFVFISGLVRQMPYGPYLGTYQCSITVKRREDGRYFNITYIGVDSMLDDSVVLREVFEHTTTTFKSYAIAASN